ncbi:VanW family protein [Shimazuella sp. AN120528]|uniref:VanW family protein n=1 Tax=Shimazuella soli TaxID=1892854 RepID=UPI001F0FE8D3|nr:VanW family protein [Shimazuella soli]MCH5583930.1 VanW family protein [Shimazuella soli]
MFTYLYACFLLLLPPIFQNGSPNPVMHVTYGEKQWYLDLRHAGFDGIDPTTLDRQKLHRWFAKIAKQINHNPTSAHYEDRQIVPEKSGRKVILSEMDSWMDLIHLYIGKKVKIPVEIQRPKLTIKELRKLKRKLLASYTTFYNNSMDNRSHNVELSAKAIDHIVVMPGEIFSFNQTVGRRTIARGYREAKIIVKGEYSEGIGGGICQTSSTLFNSVDQAKLTIIERKSHSRDVPYVPKNKDATVSWGGPDFKFKNLRNSPILIVSEAKKGYVTVQIFTSK